MYDGLKKGRRLPQITEDSWPYTIGSYDIRIFKDNKDLNNKLVKKIFRDPFWPDKLTNNEIIQQVEDLCDIKKIEFGKFSFSKPNKMEL